MELELISSLRAKAAPTRSCVLRPSLQQHDRQARRPSDRIGSHVHRAGGHIQEAVQEARDRGPGFGHFVRVDPFKQTHSSRLYLAFGETLFAYRAVQSRLAEDYWETCKPAKSKKSKAAAPTKESKPSKAAKPEPKAKAKAKAKAAAKDGKKEEKPKPKAKAAPKPETKMDDKAPGVSSVHILQPVHWPAGCSAHSMVCCAKTGGENTHCAELIGCLQFFKGGESHPVKLIS